MIDNVVNWIKLNKIKTLIVVVVGYFILSFSSSLFGANLLSVSQRKVQPGVRYDIAPGAPASSLGSAGLVVEELAAPSFELDKRSSTSITAEDRIVIRNSNLSLLVKDVREAGDKILDFAKKSGGFMVSTSYNRPNESPFATITVRVPSEQFDAALNYFRSLSIKVTSENLVGTDVTEQFIDLDERILTLTRTKTRFEEIMEQAVEIDDILRVQRELINLQNQIDSYKGQKEALQKEADLTKFTIYLATDELSLPYAPDEKFRPDVVFKLAVRSLLGSLRDLANVAIWIGVYAVIWVPALIGYILIKRWRKKTSTPQVPTN